MMADHGEVEYATAQGNDYAEHEGTYENFLHRHPARPGDRRRHGPLADGLCRLRGRDRRGVPRSFERVENVEPGGLRLGAPGVCSVRGRLGRTRMRIAVAREIESGEPRVAATPETVKKLTNL